MGQPLSGTILTRGESGYQFAFIGTISPERDTSGKIMAFTPHTRFKNTKNLTLYRYGRGPFCRFRIGSNIHVGGVYLIIADNHIKYVGESEDLSNRFGLRNYGSIQPRNCYRPRGQSTNCKINHHVLAEAQQSNQIELWFHQMPGANKAARRAIEAVLIAEFNPSWNG